jgi:hypothetical protein
MTLNTTVRAQGDPDLRARIDASIFEQAINNPNIKDTVMAGQVKGGYAPPFTALYWAVAQAVDDDYQAGIEQRRGSPGHDPDIVTDQAITDAVVANWPPDPPTPALMAPAPAMAPADSPAPVPADAPAPDKPAKVVSKRGTK